MRSEVAARSGQRRTRGGVALGGLVIALGVGLAVPNEAMAATSTIHTVAGTDDFNDFFGDGGPATAAGLSEPLGVAAMSGGGYLIADAGNARVRQVSPAGIITTVAGNGTFGSPSGDGGPATQANLVAPLGVTVMPDGGYLIADARTASTRRVSPTGTITTVAGTGTRGYGGDGGPATVAQLFAPSGVAAM